MVRLFALCLCFALIFSGSAFSQTPADVRGADHEGYSRLVLEHKAIADYALNKADGTLTLTLKSAAAPNDLALDDLRNLKGLRVTSSAPLTLEVSISPQSRVRDLIAGNRLIIDVYDPPPGAAPPPSAAQQEPAAGQAAEEEAAAKAVPQKPPETAQEEKSETPAQKPSRPAPRKPEEQSDARAPSQIGLKAPKPQAAAEKAVKAEKTADSAPADISKVLQDITGQAPDQAPPMEEATRPARNLQALAAAHVDPTVVTISATKTMNVAAFVHGGQYWMLTDKDDLIVSPNITGPQADAMKPVKAQSVPMGKAFLMRVLDPAGPIRGQGGGLVWRLIVGGQQVPPEPTAIQRIGTSENAERGASLLWPFAGAGAILDVPDPETGRTLKVVTVPSAAQFAGPARDFVDFSVLESPIGLTILPRVDDLSVEKTPEGILVTRPGGLSVMPEKMIMAAQARLQERENKQQAHASDDPTRLFDFKNWQIGTADALNENEIILLSSLAHQTIEGQVEGLITLAQMYLAHGFWSEARGFLEFAGDELPDLEDNPAFKGLKGAALALGLHSEEAFEILSDSALDPYPEIGYWRAFALADLGDWQQAAEVLPENDSILLSYPEELANRLSLVLAEVDLRAGEVDRAETLLNAVEERTPALKAPQKAALDYLRGEAQRQRKKTDETVKLWEPLTKGPDDLYRAKAGLALSRLLTDEKKIKPAEAIDQLERLRYAWRGDELEAQINYWLGRTYFEAGEHVKGLNTLREAASLASGTDLGSRITGEMTEMFTNLFLSEDLYKIKPLEAAALYDQFSELIPAGPRGDKVVERLAEHLVTGDLLARASKLLDYQFNHRLKGADALRIGKRLAAIELLDKEPQKALKVLQRAQSLYDALPADQKTAAGQQELALLRARSLSQQGQSDEAVEFLDQLERTPDANRLRADIAWRAGYWDDAAEALGDVIVDEAISLTRPLSPEHTMLILQRALALNLASDRIALANMREKYSDAMTQTDKARIFEVITRPRQSSALADRETLMSIVSEVDLFADFLNSYKAQAPSAAPAPAPTPTQSQAPPAQ